MEKLVLSPVREIALQMHTDFVPSAVDCKLNKTRRMATTKKSTHSPAKSIGTGVSPQPQTTVTTAVPRYEQTYDALVHSLRYLFFNCKRGIFVKIAGNRVAIFAMFSNETYVNVWHHCYPTFHHAAAGSSASALKQWFRNGHILLPPTAPDEYDDKWRLVLDMLIELCENRTVPDIDFVLNVFDHPQLRRDHLEPGYQYMLPKMQTAAGDHDGKKTAVVQEAHQSHIPVMSACSNTTSNQFMDICMPLSDDWRTVQQHGDRREAAPTWKTKIATCFFRGSSCGLGTRVSSNQRMYAAYLSLLWSKDDARNGNNALDKTLFLDAAIDKWDLSLVRQPTKDGSLSLSQTAVGRDTDPLQLACARNESNSSSADIKSAPPAGAAAWPWATYKYVLYVPGQSAIPGTGSHDVCYSHMMTLGAVIFKVAQQTSSTSNDGGDACSHWFSQHLEPMVDHIPVRSDLSDLATQIEWAKRNDAECERIAQRCALLYQKKVGKNAIFDHWQRVLRENSVV